jgi:hypothetical protein
MDGKWLRQMVRLAVVAILLAGWCLAQQNEIKPRCTAKVQGRYWPERANSDAQLAATLARSGELEMCVVRVWKHRWEPLTVHVSQLGKGHGRKTEEDNSKAPRTD